MTIIFQNCTVFRAVLHFSTVFKKWKVCTPSSTLKKYFLQHMQKQNLKYLSKTTFYQILDCTTLKVWATGSLNKFLNPCKSASHLYKKKIQKNYKLLFWWNYLTTNCMFSDFFLYTNWPSLLYSIILYYGQATSTMHLQCPTYSLLQ